ncbi:MAG: xanthine dehydrogenase family protein subunit M [Bacteroidetes bacterium]|nr:xanthine dehydrogenase family protein subunit M [Bacteroidota bacterium]
MYLKDFNYLRPKSLVEACEMLQNSKDGALIAGGTDLLVEMKMGLRHHEDIISLADVDELKQIEDGGDYIIIGSGATHSSIVNSSLLKENYIALSEASSNVGTEQVRNAATVGGNICTGASCCDTGPVLLASDCILELTDGNLSREISVNDFFVFHRKTALKKGEILTKIKVPKLKKGTGISIEKFGLRGAASISVASAVTFITINNGVCVDAKIVIGAVAPTPFVSESASKILIGAKIHDLINDSDVLNQAGDAAVDESEPLTDIRGSADYRKKLIKVLVKRTIKKAASRATN